MRSIFKTIYYAPIFCLMMALFMAALPQSASAANDPQGYWLTQNERSVIHIGQCADQKTLCGSIYWIIEGGMQHDTKNPEESLRTRPLCQLQIMSGFEKQDDKFWVDGEIYKADSGDDYHSTIQVISDEKIEVRGYVGMPLFGKSQIWTRVSKNAYTPCAAE